MAARTRKEKVKNCAGRTHLEAGNAGREVDGDVGGRTHRVAQEPGQDASIYIRKTVKQVMLYIFMLNAEQAEFM